MAKTLYLPRDLEPDELADIAVVRTAIALTHAFISSLASLPNLKSEVGEKQEYSPGCAALEAAGWLEGLAETIEEIQKQPEREQEKIEDDLYCEGSSLDYDTQIEDSWEFGR